MNQLAVWTSASASYARVIVDHLFGSHIPLSFVWSHAHCTLRMHELSAERVSTKNLKKVKKRGYDLRRVLIADNSPEKVSKHYGNLIPIQDFEGQQNDTELKQLMCYLPWLAAQPNVRTLEKRTWRSQAHELVRGRDD